MHGGTTVAHRADVQGLRGVAVLLVVVFHAGLPLTGGFVGVDVFFVISGFVIAAMLARQLEADEFTFRNFYVRRARRVLPALGVLLAFVAVAGMLFLSPYGPQQFAADTGVAAALFHANFQLNGVPGGYFNLAAETNALLHTWSLSVEEQFYFVFPAVFVGAWRLSTRFDKPGTQRRTVGFVLGAVTVASFAHSTMTTLHPSLLRGQDYAFFSPFSRAWEFGVGALLALWAPKLRGGRVFGWAGAVMVLAAAVWFDDATAFPGPWALLPVAGTALILAGGGLSGVLESRPLVRLGDLSYGWYLWHWPFIVFAAAMWPRSDLAPVVAAAGSLAPAVLSYRLVEQPIRFHPRVVGVRVVAMSLACCLVPIVGFAGMRAVGESERESWPLLGEVPARPAVGTGPRVMLVGDSNAMHFRAPLQAAASALGYDGQVSAVAGCPFADVARESSHALQFDGRECSRSVAATIAGFEADPPALVVVAMAGPMYLNEGHPALTDPVSGEVATTPERKAVVLAAGLERTLTRLDGAGVPVVLVHTIPHLGDEGGDWVYRTCAALRFLTETCGVSIDRSEAEARRDAARVAEQRAVDAVPGVASVDFIDDLCTDVCSSRRGGVWLYRDALHLSDEGALTLTAEFRDLIESHAMVIPGY